MDLTARWEQLDREAYEIPHEPARLPEREPLLIERLRIARTFGLDDPRLEQSHGNLLHFFYCDVSDYAKVEPVCRYWIALKRDRLTASQHDLHVLFELGLSLSMKGENASTESTMQYRRALQLAEEAHGPDHSVTQTALFQLGQHLHNAKRYAEAVEIGERLLVLRRQGLAAEARDADLGFCDRATLLSGGLLMSRRCCARSLCSLRGGLTMFVL